MTFLAAAALAQHLVLTSAAPITHRVSPLLIPMDQGAEAKSLKLEAYMNEALEEFPQVLLKKSDDLFGIPPDDDAEIALKHAESAYAEARVAFEATQYEDAEKKLRNALSAYQKAGSAMTDTLKYCDALAMSAAVTFIRGDTEEAKLTLLDLISLNPNYDLPTKRFSRDFIQLRSQVASSRNAALRGTLNVRSKPAGARVFLDGEFQSYTPANLQTLPVGKHLLRIERPGFKQFGQFVEVTPEDQEVEAELRPTTAYRAYDALIDKVAAEVSREKPGPSLAALGKALGLDRAIVGVVKEISTTGATEVSVGLFDMHNGGKKLSFKRIIFQGEEYGQLKYEVARLVNYLVNAADGNGGERASNNGDPLTGRSGTDEWGGEDRGGKGSTEKTRKQRSADPLDGHSGMEDW